MELHVLRRLVALSVAAATLAQPVLAQECYGDQYGNDAFAVAMASPFATYLAVQDSRLEVIAADSNSATAMHALMPDAMIVTAPLLGELIQMDAAIPLDDHLDAFEPFLSGTQPLRAGGKAYALPLVASSRVWVVHGEIASVLEVDPSAIDTDIFDFLERAQRKEFALGLDYSDSDAVAADFLSVFNGLSDGGLRDVPNFAGDAGLQALDALKHLTDFADRGVESTDQIMNGFAQGHYAAISAWAGDVDRHWEMISVASPVIIAPPSLVPGKQPVTELFWTGVAFTKSLTEEEMLFAYCSLQAALARSRHDAPHRLLPLQWTHEGLAWSRGGEGVVSSLGHEARFAPAHPLLSALPAQAGPLAKEAIWDQDTSIEAVLHELDESLRRSIEDLGMPECIRNQSCYTSVLHSLPLKTGGGGTCSKAACSSGQACCNGQCQKAPCK